MVLSATILACVMSIGPAFSVYTCPLFSFLLCVPSFSGFRKLVLRVFHGRDPILPQELVKSSVPTIDVYFRFFSNFSKFIKKPKKVRLKVLAK